VEKQNKICLAKFYEKNAATSKEKKENNATQLQLNEKKKEKKKENDASTLQLIQANEKKKENNATSFIQANKKKKEKKKENDASTFQLLQAKERLKKKKENIARVKERIEKEKKKKMTTNLDQLQQRIPNISIIPIVQLIENQPSEPVLENETKIDSLHSTNFTFSFKEKEYVLVYDAQTKTHIPVEILSIDQYADGILKKEREQKVLSASSKEPLLENSSVDIKVEFEMGDTNSTCVSVLDEDETKKGELNNGSSAQQETQQTCREEDDWEIIFLG
jgi:hypothetical protein